MIEWLLSYLRRMTDEQKRELARAFFAPSQIMFKLMERENVTVQVVDEFIQSLEKMSKEEPADQVFFEDNTERGRCKV